MGRSGSLLSSKHPPSIQLSLPRRDAAKSVKREGGRERESRERKKKIKRKRKGKTKEYTVVKLKDANVDF